MAQTFFALVRKVRLKGPFALSFLSSSDESASALRIGARKITSKSIEVYTESVAPKAGSSTSGGGSGMFQMTSVKVCYRQLAREYHPDKNNQEVTGLTTTEALDFFKLLNNANMFLRGRM